MFGVLRQESDSIALERGAQVDISMPNLLRIQEAEGLDKHTDLASLFFIVRTYLEDWCRANIKGVWRVDKEIIYPPDENTETILRFQFSNKREAVRFKLTWGGR